MESNNATTALPEELVREHLDAIVENINPVLDSVMQAKTYPETAIRLLGSEDCAEKSTAITIDYMGKVLEWAAKAGWEFSYKGDCWHCLSYQPISTSQLITLFFQKQSKP